MHVKNKLNVTYPTARADLRKLEGWKDGVS